MKRRANNLIILAAAIVSLFLFTINTFAQKTSFTTDKTNRTLIKEMVLVQNEIRSDQKEVLKLLRSIHESIKK